MGERAVQTPLSELFHEDETAWLEEMASLASERRFAELDLQHLSEYLTDMARRDQREVLSRLTSLFTHLLKWEFQPEQRSNGWQATIAVQRRELGDLLESGSLMNHAHAVLGKAYKRAVKQASLETALAEASFPKECPFSLETMFVENS